MGLWVFSSKYHSEKTYQWQSNKYHKVEVFRIEFSEGVTLIKDINGPAFDREREIAKEMYVNHNGFHCVLTKSHNIDILYKEENKSKCTHRAGIYKVQKISLQ